MLNREPSSSLSGAVVMQVILYSKSYARDAMKIKVTVSILPLWSCFAIDLDKGGRYMVRADSRMNVTRSWN